MKDLTEKFDLVVLLEDIANLKGDKLQGFGETMKPLGDVELTSIMPPISPYKENKQYNQIDLAPQSSKQTVKLTMRLLDII